MHSLFIGSRKSFQLFYVNLWFVFHCSRHPQNLQQRVSQRKSLMRLTQKGTFRCFRSLISNLFIVFPDVPLGREKFRWSWLKFCATQSTKWKENLPHRSTKRFFSSMIKASWKIDGGKIKTNSIIYSSSRSQTRRHLMLFKTQMLSDDDEVPNMPFALTFAIFQRFRTFLFKRTHNELRWVNYLHKKMNCAIWRSTTTLGWRCHELCFDWKHGKRIKTQTRVYW